jgi:hypothetical protein
MRKFNVVYMLLIFALILGCSDDGDGILDKAKPVTIHISPGEIQGGMGTDFDIDIIMENASDVFSVSFELAFQDNIIEAQETAATKGDLFGNSALFFAKGEDGKVSVGVTLPQSGGEDAVNGSGTIATIHLTGLSVGSSPLTITNLEVVDENAQLIPKFDQIVVVNGMYN